MAFQIRDDVLDVTGTTEDFGKRIGGDIARYGDDESVGAIRHGPKARFLFTTRRTDLMATTGEFAKAIKDNNPDLTKLDADGLGGGVVDRLREQGFKIAEIHGVSSGTVHNHIKKHNKELETKGECSMCRRVNSEYFQTKSSRARLYVRINS